MTVEEWIDACRKLIWYGIRKKTNLMWDEQEDRFQDVCMVICEKIDKLNNMPEKQAKMYIYWSTVRMPKRHTWGNAKFMTLLDADKRRKELSGRGIEEKEDPLAWLDDGGKYRPDSEYWEYLRRRERRENAQDQLEQYKIIKKLCAGVHKAKIYGGNKGFGLNATAYQKAQLNAYAAMISHDPLFKQERAMKSRLYRGMNKEKIKEHCRQKYNDIRYDPVKHAAFLARNRERVAKRQMCKQKRLRQQEIVSQTYFGGRLEAAFQMIENEYKNKGA